MSDAFLLTGTRQKEPEPIELRAGWLSAELVNGNLRTVRWKGVEVLRAVSYLVRDRDWGTYEPVLADLEVEQGSDGFAVSFSASSDATDGSRIRLSAAIKGTVEGQLAFEVSAVPQDDFETNRCGFCILHPIVGVAGGSVSIEHTDGRVVETVLPRLIEPWQPFKLMRAITHPVAPGVSAECRMEGDTPGMDSWEMEDQRNWSDASFKTYVRPLALPWPYRMKDAQPVRQSVQLTVSDASQMPPRPLRSDQPVHVRLGTSGPPLPSIGVVIYPEDVDTALDNIAQLRRLGVQRLLLHFDPTAGHGIDALRGFARLAAGYPADATLECVVAAAAGSGAAVDRKLRETADLVARAGLRLDAVAVSPSVDRQSTPPGSRWPDCPPLETVYAAARRAFPGLRLGGGMFSYFTELNRKRVPAEALDFITHCTCPLVHAGDDLSVMQTLEALPFITASVRAIYGDKAYRIGPSTLAMRQNPYGSETKANPANIRLPMADRDPRHNALFGAAWALGYAARVAPAGLEQLTLSSFTGPFGLIAGEKEPALPGTPRPLFEVVRMLAGMAGLPMLEADLGGDSRAAVLAARSADGRLRLCCGNLTPDVLVLDLSAIALGESAEKDILDEAAVAAGGTTGARLEGQTLRLGPYAVAFLG